MPRTHTPHRGSKAYHPRSRAARIYHSFATKPVAKERGAVAEFAGYKVGMTLVTMINDRKGSPNFNQEIAVPATIIEAPPLKVFGVRAYRRAPNGYGIAPAIDVLSSELDKNLARRMPLPKKRKTSLEAFEKNLSSFLDIQLLVHTQPSKAGIDKRTPEVFEVAISGTNVQEKFAAAKEKLGKDISVSEVFKPGQLVDVSAVTRGFGWQGSVKRYGVHLLPHKSQKLRRKAANLGPWHPAKVRWTVPQMGQMGFHTRTEYNHRVLKVSDNLEEMKNPAGWKRYGVISSPYLVLHGSVPGHVKRLIMMRQAVRPYEQERQPQIEAVMVKQ